jgi:ABC-type Zn2+ transport system substrate-binding protein/surface adhesin
MDSHAARRGCTQKIKIEQTERPNMKLSKTFTLLAVTLLPLLTMSAQTSPTTASQANAVAGLSPAAAEVAKIAKSGVGDDGVLSFIGQSKSYYNLSVADIAALKNAGL